MRGARRRSRRDSGRTYFRRNVRGRSNARWMATSGHERQRRAGRDTFRARLRRLPEPANPPRFARGRTPGRQPGSTFAPRNCNWRGRRFESARPRCFGSSLMAKKITGYIKLQVPAGAANPSPPIGPALGQRGLNIMEFCKAFNAQTQKMEKGAPIPVTITVYADRSFTFELRTPPVSHFLKKAAKLESGSKTPGRDIAGSVTKAQVREIAEQKMKDLNCDTIEAAMRMIEGSARSMGLEVKA